MPMLIEAMERHGHLMLDEKVREQLLSVSAATIDRRLRTVRGEAFRAKRQRRRANKVQQHCVDLMNPRDCM
jgi:hypothetical protein